MTQKEFAKFIEIKYTTYRNFEQSGKISFENFLIILDCLNKAIEFENFLSGFEFTTEKNRIRVNKEEDLYSFLKPIIPPSQKQITLDKEIFGKELFYSVENGHIYNVSTLISIILNKYNDERLILLLKYFGVDRLKPYILKEKNIDLLKRFNTHVKILQTRSMNA
jgi:hypothetical protein